MSKGTQRSLGLPSFTTRLAIGRVWWSQAAYSAIHQLHVFKGFDPTTTDFARSLGFPILNVVGDEARFEEIEGTFLHEILLFR